MNAQDVAVCPFCRRADECASWCLQHPDSIARREEALPIIREIRANLNVNRVKVAAAREPEPVVLSQNRPGPTIEQQEAELKAKRIFLFNEWRRLTTDGHLPKGAPGLETLSRMTGVFPVTKLGETFKKLTVEQARRLEGRLAKL